MEARQREERWRQGERERDLRVLGATDHEGIPIAAYPRPYHIPETHTYHTQYHIRDTHTRHTRHTHTRLDGKTYLQGFLHSDLHTSYIHTHITYAYLLRAYTNQGDEPAVDGPDAPASAAYMGVEDGCEGWSIFGWSFFPCKERRTRVCARL